jgi:hypothetical protein
MTTQEMLRPTVVAKLLSTLILPGATHGVRTALTLVEGTEEDGDDEDDGADGEELQLGVSSAARAATVAVPAQRIQGVSHARTVRRDHRVDERRRLEWGMIGS